MAWHKAADIEVFKDEVDVVGVVIAGEPVALYRLDNGYFATSNVCTHEFALLSDGYVENGCIECPLHQGLFDIATGACRGGPVDQPIKTYPVRIDGPAIMVELPG